MECEPPGFPPSRECGPSLMGPCDVNGARCVGVASREWPGGHDHDLSPPTPLELLAVNRLGVRAGQGAGLVGGVGTLGQLALPTAIADQPSARTPRE